MSIVGRVVGRRLWMEPHGTHNPQFGRPLKAAKWQFTLRADDPGSPFRDDFIRGVQVIRDLQAGVSKSNLQE